MISQIKKWRLQKGWTQWDLAIRLGVRPTSIYRWETGLVEPSELNLEKLKGLGWKPERVSRT